MEIKKCLKKKRNRKIKKKDKKKKSKKSNRRVNANWGKKCPPYLLHTINSSSFDHAFSGQMGLKSGQTVAAMFEKMILLCDNESELWWSLQMAQEFGLSSFELLACVSSDSESLAVPRPPVVERLLKQVSQHDSVQIVFLGLNQWATESRHYQ